MSVKKEVLKKLEENRGMFFSGEELAGELGVTRASVWKAINSLKEEGHKIVGVSNKGYCLLVESDILSADGVRMHLDKEYARYPITVFDETVSTNLDAKKAAAEGASHGSVFLAEQQTGGKGRRGRSFVSFEGKCIYMSIVLRPNLEVAKSVFVTTAASVAVCRAIQSVTGKETKIKWVNDVFYRGKKICGILTEAVTDCETGMVDSLIVGIGINYNVNTDLLPDELKDIAGSLYEGDAKIQRNQLIAEILNQIFNLCASLPEHSFIEEYKRYSMIVGEEIYIVEQESYTEAQATDIDSEGGLVVELKDGTIRTLSSGEVTIRKK